MHLVTDRKCPVYLREIYPRTFVQGGLSFLEAGNIDQVKVNLLTEMLD
jgi:hypothetical protein